MKLSEIFNQLAYGELSQMAMVDDETGQIATKKYQQLVSHVNLGLTALYKRFPLKEGRLTLKLEENRMTYPLNTSDSVTFVENINDGEFSDDILKVERVYTAAGKEMGLNDLNDPYSCMTPSATVLRVPLLIAADDPDLPDNLQTDTLTVVYRANHPTINYNAAFNPARINVELPVSHLEPLLLFIASRVNNPIGLTNEFNAGNNYASKYEKSCQQLELVNLRVDQGSSSTKLTDRGWV